MVPVLSKLMSDEYEACTVPSTICQGPAYVGERKYMLNVPVPIFTKVVGAAEPRSAVSPETVPWNAPTDLTPRSTTVLQPPGETLPPSLGPAQASTWVASPLSFSRVPATPMLDAVAPERLSSWTAGLVEEKNWISEMPP